MQKAIQGEKRTRDHGDALDEFRYAPSMKMDSQTTPNKPEEKQLTHKKVDGVQVPRRA